MEIENYTKAMSLFVGKDTLRPIFHKPYEQKGYYYATDAHALIRIDGSLNLGFDSQDRPNTEAVIKPNTHTPIEINLIELETYLDTITPDVADSYECNNCDGCGYEKCNLGHEHRCELCDGEGEISFNPVRFVKDKYAQYKMWDGYISRHILQRMFDACKILGIDKVSKVSGGGNTQYKFLTENILFLLMPVMEDDSRNQIPTKL